MGALNDTFDSLKERVKTALQEQQESELFISLKERYESLSANGQFLVKWGSIAIIALLILWIPFSSFMDSSTLNAEFEERRQALKELLKIERDYATINLANSPAPFAMKNIMDQKLLAFGVKVEQIKDSVEVNEPVFGSKNVDQKGIRYQLQHLTIRQAIDIAYEFEQMDKHFKLADFELAAETADPHYYNLKLKIITFVPKVQAVANAK